MNNSFKFLVIIILFLFILASFWFVYEYVKINQPQRILVIIGEGKETVVPNVAKINIGVITEGDSLESLPEENLSKMNKIINFLKEQEIDDKDIKTENYSITPKYDYSISPSRIIGYTINQNLSVKVRDLNKIGNILNGVVQQGANNVYGPYFTVDEPEVYLAKAREKAILNAKQKAEIIAKTAGLKLGKIININEYSIPQTIYSYSNGFGGFVDSELEKVPQIKPGSQEIETKITITFEIK
ncbi:MAG: SIMPL domain-containing protein [Candidatus Parcubacteria bacterium]|nr:MAG: SIMPL domain-containing protein [Candidatus Parcubacteria bacterium]